MSNTATARLLPETCEQLSIHTHFVSKISLQMMGLIITRKKESYWNSMYWLGIGHISMW